MHSVIILCIPALKKKKNTKNNKEPFSAILLACSVYQIQILNTMMHNHVQPEIFVHQ